jgi:hypothetical protein
MPIELFTAHPDLLYIETKKDSHYFVKGSFLDKHPILYPSSRIPMAKKKDRIKKRKLAVEPAAAAYTEDLGTQGIKTNCLTSPLGYSTSISDLPLPNDEEERRQKRMVMWCSLVIL